MKLVVIVPWNVTHQDILLIQQLFDRYHFSPDMIDDKDSDGGSAMDYAIEAGNQPIIDLFTNQCIESMSCASCGHL